MMHRRRVFSAALGVIAASLLTYEALPVAEDVVWLTGSPSSTWNAVASPSVCALDVFRFGVIFPVFRYKEQDIFKWQLIAKNVEGWVNDAVLASGPLQVMQLSTEMLEEKEGTAEEEGKQAEGLECAFDPEFCTPKLVGIRLPDVDGESGEGASLQKDHSIVLEFEQPTNRPGANSEVEIGRFVSFTEYIGDELIGAWSDDGRVLVLRIEDIDAEKVKPVGELMQGLLLTSISVAEGKERGGRSENMMVLYEGLQSLRVEPPGVYAIRVSGQDVVFWSPEVRIVPCDASFIVLDPTRAIAPSGEGLLGEVLSDTHPSFAIDGVLTYGGDEGFVLPHDSIQMEMPSSWGLSFWVFLTEDSTATGEKDAFAMLGRRYRASHASDVEIATYHYYHAAVEAASVYHQLGKQPLHEMTRLYDSFERDITVGERGDDDELIQFQKLRADNGDVEAMAAMGDLYYWGAHGVPRDHTQAYNYFNRAAQAGNVNSQSAVAGMLLKGEGTAQDNVTAIKWYEKASEKNHTRALNGLGFIHFHGSGGVPGNKTLALEYFERAAANKEDGDSIFNAGYCHAMGLGTSVNVSRAMEFYDMAAREFGHFDAIFEMGKILMIGVPGVVSRNSERALEYLKAASDGGQWGRVVRKGFDLYTDGEFERAVVAYHEARELGYPVATSNLAFVYDQRLLQPGNLANERRAHKYLLLANNENGDRETLVRIGDYHYYGLAGLRKDPKTALRWYSRASAEGVAVGAFNVGQIWVNRNSVGNPIRNG
ncbi:hypothetical protein PC115_g8813 [Phytophthora cactorum]|uniref:Uncharacterized protein n=1 Tax=Phytophthora cactorum TaxID=29920 RepID=A0A8T1CFX3_9STRA|nr:hypothetical protein PC115_g8813 [Phytophthora cactorum]